MSRSRWRSSGSGAACANPSPAPWTARTLARVRLAYALGLLLALDVSLGFNGLIYRGLYDYFLPFKALRVPARMGLMVGFSLAVLAGYGAARIAERAALAADAARRADDARRC